MAMHGYAQQTADQGEQSSPSPGTLAALVDTAKGQRQTLERISDQLRELVDRIAGSPTAVAASGGQGMAPRAVPNGLLAAIREELDRADAASTQIDGHLARLSAALR